MGSIKNSGARSPTQSKALIEPPWLSGGNEGKTCSQVKTWQTDTCYFTIVPNLSALQLFFPHGLGHNVMLHMHCKTPFNCGSNATCGSALGLSPAHWDTISGSPARCKVTLLNYSMDSLRSPSLMGKLLIWDGAAVELLLQRSSSSSQRDHR